MERCSCSRRAAPNSSHMVSSARSRPASGLWKGGGGPVPQLVDRTRSINRGRYGWGDSTVWGGLPGCGRRRFVGRAASLGSAASPRTREVVCLECGLCTVRCPGAESAAPVGCQRLPWRLFQSFATLGMMNCIVAEVARNGVAGLRQAALDAVKPSVDRR